ARAYTNCHGDHCPNWEPSDSCNLVVWNQLLAQPSDCFGRTCRRGCDCVGGPDRCLFWSEERSYGIWRRYSSDDDWNIPRLAGVLDSLFPRAASGTRLRDSSIDSAPRIAPAIRAIPLYSYYLH